MTADSVPAPMVQVPAAELERVIDALKDAGNDDRRSISTLVFAMDMAENHLRRLLDAATPAASVPAADILALADEWDRENPEGSEWIAALIWGSNELRALVAAAEQADKGEAADTPRDEWDCWCQGTAKGDPHYSHKDGCPDAPAAPPDPSFDSVKASVHRATRGGYTSNKQVGDLAPPPKGPAPAARVPVNDEAQAAWQAIQPAWFGDSETAFKAGFRTARGEDA